MHPQHQAQRSYEASPVPFHILAPVTPALTLDVARVGVEPHQLDRLVVAAGGDEVSHGTPGQAVDGALVVLGALEQHRGLVGDVVISGKQAEARSSYRAGQRRSVEIVQGKVLKK